MATGSTADLRHVGLGEIVRRSARRHPHKIALEYKGRTLTYKNLAEMAGYAAAGLVSLGVGPGDRVAVMGRNSDTYAITWLGCLILGAVHVPINFMLGASEVGFILENSGSIVAIADASLFETARSAVRERNLVTTLLVLERDHEGDAEGEVDFSSLWSDRPYDEPVISGEMTAQIAYTSGTESSPKGCMLSHSGLLAQYVSCVVGGEYSPEDRVLNSLPLYHCAQMHCFLMPSLYVGSTNVILRDANPDAMIDAISVNRLTSIFAPPTVWIGLLRNERFTAAAMDTVTKGYYGASIMPTQIVHQLMERLPKLRLWNYYGQTELGPLATILGPEEQLSKIGSAGLPALNVETRIVNDEMQDVAVGEVGEVVHRSPQVLTGYYQNDEQTRKAFSGGWFHSGDLATRDSEGYITIVDRKKDMINSGGENVSSREVEETIYEHVDVAEVAVIGLPDHKWIETVCAVVVLHSGREINESQLQEFVKARLASYKTPKRIVFVSELPKNPSGKVLKRELRASLSN